MAQAIAAVVAIYDGRQIWKQVWIVVSKKRARPRMLANTMH